MPLSATCTRWSPRSSTRSSVGGADLYSGAMTRRPVLALGVALIVVSVGVGVARGVGRDSCGEAVTDLPGEQVELALPRRGAAQGAAGRGPRPRGGVPGEGATPVRRGGRRGRLPLRAVGTGVVVRAGHRGAHPRQPRLHDARRSVAAAVVERAGRHQALDVRRRPGHLPGRHPARGRSRPTSSPLDADTGKRRWCATLGGPSVGEADPFATPSSSTTAGWSCSGRGRATTSASRGLDGEGQAGVGARRSTWRGRLPRRPG